MLDSWVRFEQQAKESEQADLVKAVVDSVMKSLADPKTQKDVLASAVAEIERASRASPCVPPCCLFPLQSSSRTRPSRRYCRQHVVRAAGGWNEQLLLPLRDLTGASCVASFLYACYMLRYVSTHVPALRANCVGDVQLIGPGTEGA